MNRKKLTVRLALATCAMAMCVSANAQWTGYAGIKPEMSEFYEPVPPVVTPGVELADGGFTAPSDAIILFDGKDLSQWESVKGGPAEWIVKDGVFTVDKKKGDIQTKQKFESYQLHLEWRVPENITGESQARGNSGVFMQGMYEIQILDCYNNKTYVNSYRTRPTVTVIQNGVVLQNNTTILGTTEYIGFPQVKAHGAGPIILQSHGDPSEPISFRNIWIREM